MHVAPPPLPFYIFLLAKPEVDLTVLFLHAVFWEVVSRLNNMVLFRCLLFKSDLEGRFTLLCHLLNSRKM